MTSFEDYFSSNLNTDFTLRLVHPKKPEAKAGQLLHFEVEINNPHGVPIEFLQLLLKQTKVVAVNGALKVLQSKIADVVNGPGCTMLSWYDQLRIPLIEPTTTRSPTEALKASRTKRYTSETVEVRYHLQILATQCESFSFKSDEYPLTILPPSTASTSATISDVPVFGPSRPRFRVGRIGQSLPRRNTAPDLLHEHVPCQSRSFLLPDLGARGPSVSPPPNYSMLSLLGQRSGSVETIPPSYEDALK